MKLIEVKEIHYPTRVHQMHVFPFVNEKYTYKIKFYFKHNHV